MRKLKSILTTLWLMAGSYSGTVWRLASLGGESGSAKPETTAAAGAAAAGTVGAAALLRGCKVAVREAPILVEDAGRAGVRLTEGLAGSHLDDPARSLARLDQLERLEMTGTRPGEFSRLAGETNAGKALTSEQVLSRWQTDAEFRPKTLEEISAKYLDFDDPLLRYRIHLPTQLQRMRADIAAVIDSEPIILYDANGRPIAKSLENGLEANAVYREKAVDIFEEVMQQIPPSKYKSDAELRSALQKVFESQRRAEYSFDVSTGKLKLKFKTKHGEITGEVNAYSIAKKVAATSLSGWGAYKALTYGGESSQGSSAPGRGGMRP